ncbi:MAG: NAD(+)/NADH kinase [Candidatus Methanoplasma sp.]|jgi:NAD+ kinase|nr:NAD(+)/NADH kinase [Candidatus Methanoplasma sp.]
MMDVLSRIADAVEEAVRKIPDSKCRGECIGVGADGTSTSQIDKIAENTVLAFIQRNNIPLNVLSEEIGFVDNGAVETLVLDPIDGTSNAIAGVPLFTISMAIGTRSLADIHTAYLRNLVTGDVMTAEKGKGAYKNGSRVRVRKADMDDLFLMIYLGNGAHPASFDLAKRVKSSRSYGCASLEMSLVAEGEADGFMMHAERYSRAIRVVDIAASVLILREAGGEVYDLDGNVLDMSFDLDCHSNFIAFGDRKVYEFIIKTENKVPESLVYGICVNTRIPEAKEYAKRVINALEGCDYVLEEGAASELKMKGCPVEDMKVDIMIIIGGDGTILRTSMRNKAPLIGINAGGVGFLAEINVKEIEEGIRRLRNGEYVVEERFKLSSWYDGKYLAEAVNEAVIHTDSIAKIRHFKVYVNDKLMTEVRADGIIVSTPTGSTCYAMSLGAPLIDPRVNAVVVVPMAAYKFASRPFVVPADTKVTVETMMDSGCLLVVDGQEEYEIKGKTHIDFGRSSETVRFIRFNTDFYSRVREKLVNAI